MLHFDEHFDPISQIVRYEMKEITTRPSSSSNQFPSFALLKYFHLF